MESFFKSCEVDGVDYNYLRPPPEVLEIMHSDGYEKTRLKKKLRRTVFAHVKYEEEEIQQINELKEFVREEKLTLPPWWSDVDYCKRVHVGDFVLSQSKEFEEWKQALRDQLNFLDELSARKQISKNAIEILTSGMIYIGGRDPQFRPLLVLDVEKILVINEQAQSNLDVFMEALIHLLTIIVQYMFVPYHVENWIMIFDIKEKFVLGIPKKVIKVAGVAIGYNFPGTLERIYMVNASRSLDILWTAVKPFTNPFTVEKTVVLRPKEMEIILEKIPPEFLESKFGGSRPNISQFWPPKKDMFTSSIALKELIRRNRTPFIYTSQHWNQVFRISKPSVGYAFIAEMLNISNPLKEEHIEAMTKDTQATGYGAKHKTFEAQKNLPKNEDPSAYNASNTEMNESFQKGHVYDLETKIHLRLK